MKPIFNIFFAIAFVISVSVSASAQSRSLGARSLVLDDGAGNITTLVAPSGGSGTITLPSLTLTFPATNGSGVLTNDGSGILSWATVSGGTGGVNLQLTTPGTQQTGNINVSGTVIAGGTLNATGGAIQTNSTTRIANNGAAAFTALATNVVTDGTGGYQFGPTDFTVIETANGGTVFLPLPSAGRIVAVKFDNSTPGATMVLAPSAFVTIDGNYSITLHRIGSTVGPSAVILVFDGTSGFIIGSH
ncbi:MAG TPA: hypothetical protein VFH95_12700 [Candidatus Kapabacteria bacterium]|nr:hypothetical protein [Candidatus Kapabacteria bacterium]